MAQTQLTARQIMMVVLVFVILMGGIITIAVAVGPPAREGPEVTRRVILTAGIITLLAAVWFVWLVVCAVRDRRRGVQGQPAKVSGWFHVCFGAAVALGGIVCSAVTYRSAVSAGGGTWTLYWGMIAWGVIQAIVGLAKVAQGGDETPQ